MIEPPRLESHDYPEVSKRLRNSTRGAEEAQGLSNANIKARQYNATSSHLFRASLLFKRWQQPAHGRRNLGESGDT